MTDEAWKLVGTGVVTLVVGIVLFQLQQGGRRGRLRREIREELELVKLLNEGAPVERRLAARIERLLEKYEPQPKDRTGELTARDWLGVLTVAVALLAAVVEFLPEMPAWGLLVVGVLVGAAAAAAGALFQAARDRRGLEPEE